MMVCTISKDLLITPGAKLRSVLRVVEEVSRWIYPHDAASNDLGVIEERLERCLGGQRAYCVWPWRIVNRVIRHYERSSPGRRLVRRRAVEEIRVREQDVSGAHRRVY